MCVIYAGNITVSQISPTMRPLLIINNGFNGIMQHKILYLGLGCKITVFGYICKKGFNADISLLFL